MIHETPHELAGQTVKVTTAQPLFRETECTVNYRVDDWWDRVYGQSWMAADGNPAALDYAMRSAFAGLPLDDQVIYGKTASGLAHLVHVSEIDGGHAR